MAYRNQNYMTNRKIKEDVDKNQKEYVAPQDETPLEPVSTSPITDEEPFVPITYQFISFGDDQGETKWGEGTVNTTGVEDNGYTEVEVKTNSTDQEFVGQKFFITSSANPDGTTLYPLYIDAGTTSANIYVKINTIEE